jgi:hypothetical protein
MEFNGSECDKESFINPLNVPPLKQVIISRSQPNLSRGFTGGSHD